jgi:uncharacterized protein YecE (DUF72 family)
MSRARLTPEVGGVTRDASPRAIVDQITGLAGRRPPPEPAPLSRFSVSSARRGSVAQLAGCRVQPDHVVSFLAEHPSAHNPLPPTRARVGVAAEPAAGTVPTKEVESVAGPQLRIGTSGWTYDSWRGPVYPADVPDARRLEYYASHLFDTVELNASYYRWPPDASFRSWRRRLPPGFELTVKAPRGLTHAKRLYAPEAWIARIRTSLALLEDRLGVLLVQLPPTLARDDARLDYFLGTLPTGLRVAVEFRHPSWHVEDVFGLLERRGAAYVVMSGAGLPCVLRATAGFVYVRFHGPDNHHLYGGSYDDAAMRWWADRMGEWAGQGRDVYAYFNNDNHGFAVHNGLTLRHLLAA